MGSEPWYWGGTGTPRIPLQLGCPQRTLWRGGEKRAGDSGYKCTSIEAEMCIPWILIASEMSSFFR